MYTYNSRVKFSQTGTNGKMRLTSLIDELQDASILEAEDNNIGKLSINKMGVGWVLASWQIDIIRYPDYEEPLVVGTLPYGFFGVAGMRNFFIKGQDGKDCVLANSVWGMINMETKTPARIPKEILNTYVIEEKLAMEYLPRKIELTGFAKELAPIEIMQRHIDSNHHVNNGKYIEMALERLGFENDIRRLRAEYKKPALLGNKLHVSLYENTESKIVELKHESGETAAIVEIFI